MHIVVAEDTTSSGTLQNTLKKHKTFIILSGVLLISLLFPPFHEGKFTICLFRNIFGIPFPGCGMTRAFLFLGHFHFYEAIKLNPNSPLAFFIVISMWCSNVIRLLTGKEVRIQLTHRESLLIFLISMGLMGAGWTYNL